MKAIPAVINKCKDCPYVYVMEGMGSICIITYKCRKTYKKLETDIYEDSPIPDWCPLPESNINKGAYVINSQKEVVC